MKNIVILFLLLSVAPCWAQTDLEINAYAHENMDVMGFVQMSFFVERWWNHCHVEYNYDSTQNDRVLQNVKRWQNVSKTYLELEKMPRMYAQLEQYVDREYRDTKTYRDLSKARCDMFLELYGAGKLDSKSTLTLEKMRKKLNVK